MAVVSQPGLKLVMFDCDGTLVNFEGIDYLAELAGVGEQVAELTAMAMQGKADLRTIYEQRLDLIQPTVGQLDQVGEAYVQQVDEALLDALKSLREGGFELGVLSAGFERSILPLADALEIDRQHVHGVDLAFDADDNFTHLVDRQGLTHAGGKAALLTRLREELAPACLVMVGDSVTDLECLPVADVYVGACVYYDRPEVRQRCSHVLDTYDQLPNLLRELCQ